LVSIVLGIFNYKIIEHIFYWQAYKKPKKIESLCLLFNSIIFEILKKNFHVIENGDKNIGKNFKYLKNWLCAQNSDFSQYFFVLKCSDYFKNYWKFSNFTTKKYQLDPIYFIRNHLIVEDRSISYSILNCVYIYTHI